MRKAGGGAVVALIVAVGALPAAEGASASSQPDLKSLFPSRAEIFVEESGLARLPLPPEILSECQPQLSDLRVFDRDGQEVPYLVISGPAPDTALEERLTFQPRLLWTSRETREQEGAPDIRRETFHLSLPLGVPRVWDLVIESRRSEFVRRIEVFEVEGSERRALLEGDSLFRLQRPLREKLEVTLPELSGAEYLEVTLEGEEDFFLEPSFRLEASRALPEQEQMRVELAIRLLRPEAGETIVELERPRGLVPDSLEVSTTTGSFSRRFGVWDRGPGAAEEILGEATLYRVEATEGVERLELPLEPADGEYLRVVIEDGDSPPLESLVFKAALQRPSLLFSLQAPGDGEAAGELLYGGARAFRPRYDLEGLLAPADRAVVGERARVSLALRDSDHQRLARLGPRGPNPLWDPTPALAFAMRPGTKIAQWMFQYRRLVAVPETREGLLRLKLAPETVARCRPDLADLRLVDAESRQWAYLLESNAFEGRVPLTVRRSETSDGTSRYVLELPESPLAVDELILDGPAPFFDRGFELLGTAPGRGEQARTLARDRIVRRPEDPREVSISLDGRHVVEMELRIRDGDDLPLEWSSIEARVRLPELYFAAPEGEYTLLFGDEDARPPKYELEKVRDLVLAVDSTGVVAGDLEKTPGPGVLARFRGEKGWQQILLWSAILVAALFLTWITLKLAREDPASG